MKTKHRKPVCASAIVNEPAESLAGLTARTAAALNRSIQQFVQASDQNLGHLEVQIAHDMQGLLRQAVERVAQGKADAAPPTCQVCGQPLTRCSSGHARTLQCRYGSITIQRTRGYCKRCRKWRTPADAALGLEETAR
jgi:hypothetical protein